MEAALFGNEMRSSTDLHVHRQGGETGGEVTNVLQLLRLLRLLRLLKLGRHYLGTTRAEKLCSPQGPKGHNTTYISTGCSPKNHALKLCSPMQHESKIRRTPPSDSSDPTCNRP